jgi:hypothetical protein
LHAIKETELCEVSRQICYVAKFLHERNSIMLSCVHFRSSLCKASFKLRRHDCSGHRLLQVHDVITGELMYLNSTGGDPTPTKKWVFLEQVAWRLMLCPEKVDLSAKWLQLVPSIRSETNLLNIKDSQFE